MERNASHLLTALCAAALVLATSSPALPQAGQPFSEEAVRQFVKVALLQYFDPSSMFDIVPSGVSLAGDVLTIDELTIEGKPAILRGFRGEFLAQISGVQLDMASLAAQQFKVLRSRRVTVVARSTAKDMQEGLARISTRIVAPTMHFQTGQFEITATVKQGDKLYPTQATGNFLVERGQRIHVVITQALVSGGGVPQNLIENELAKLNPILDLSKWPFNLQIQRFVLHNDRIEVLMVNRQ